MMVLRCEQNQPRTYQNLRYSLRLLFLCRGRRKFLYICISRRHCATVTGRVAVAVISLCCIFLFYVSLCFLSLVRAAFFSVSRTTTFFFHESFMLSNCFSCISCLSCPGHPGRLIFFFRYSYMGAHLTEQTALLKGALLGWRLFCVYFLYFDFFL